MEWCHASWVERHRVPEGEVATEAELKQITELLWAERGRKDDALPECKRKAMELLSYRDSVVVPMTSERHIPGLLARR